mmetsp:Transcript_34595/g.89816  ORF Transcript_34595/g.89816 Transcript_34595/m.89816 type:complete len:317 (+) Transcript_34595:335-1285(+)
MFIHVWAADAHVMPLATRPFSADAGAVDIARKTAHIAAGQLVARDALTGHGISQPLCRRRLAGTRAAIYHMLQAQLIHKGGRLICIGAAASAWDPCGRRLLCLAPRWQNWMAGDLLETCLREVHPRWSHIPCQHGWEGAVMPHRERNARGRLLLGGEHRGDVARNDGKGVQQHQISGWAQFSGPHVRQEERLQPCPDARVHRVRAPMWAIQVTVAADVVAHNLRLAAPILRREHAGRRGLVGQKHKEIVRVDARDEAEHAPPQGGEHRLSVQGVQRLQRRRPHHRSHENQRPFLLFRHVPVADPVARSRAPRLPLR